MIDQSSQPYEQPSEPLTYEQVAVLAGKSRGTVQRWVGTGRFPPAFFPQHQTRSSRCTRHLRFDADLVRAWLNDGDCDSGRTAVGPWLESHGHTVKSLERAGYKLNEYVTRQMDA